MLHLNKKYKTKNKYICALVKKIGLSAVTQSNIFGAMQCILNLWKDTQAR